MARVEVEAAPADIESSLRAPSGRYPSIMGVEQEDEKGRRYQCVAVLVAPQWALAMAYCVNPPNAVQVKYINLLYGHSDLRKANRVRVTELKFSQANSSQYPNVDGRLALLKLEKALDISPLAIVRDGIRPGSEEGAKRYSTVVAGWGAFTEAPKAILGQQLSHLTVRILPNSVCNGKAYYEGKIASTELCAQSSFEKVDVCYGFSGAPLMTPGADGRFEMLGLVSWGEGCARPNRPTVYADVTQFRAWIESVTGYVRPQAPGSGHRNRVIDIVPVPKGVKAQSRIANPGPNVVPGGAYRYVVSLGLAGRPPLDGHFCGGVLISPQWVLTAAHCVHPYVANPSGFRIRIDTSALDEPGVIGTPKRVLVHPSFHKTPFNSYKNDIALVEITARVPRDIRMPKMPSRDLEAQLEGQIQDFTVVGWGKNAFSRFGRLSNYLQQTIVKKVSAEACNSSRAYKGLVDENEMCAGTEGADACQGDSGGPLVAWDDRVGYLLVGLVSWGEGCGLADKPGVYVRLSHHHKWIASKLAESTPTDR